MNYFDIIKSNQGKILKILLIDGQTITSKFFVISKINPEDAGEINPSYIELIEDENNEEIFVDDIVSLEVLQ